MHSHLRCLDLEKQFQFRPSLSHAFEIRLLSSRIRSLGRICCLQWWDYRQNQILFWFCGDMSCVFQICSENASKSWRFHWGNTQTIFERWWSVHGRDLKLETNDTVAASRDRPDVSQKIFEKSAQSARVSWKMWSCIAWWLTGLRIAINIATWFMLWLPHRQLMSFYNEQKLSLFIRRPPSHSI